MMMSTFSKRMFVACFGFVLVWVAVASPIKAAEQADPHQSVQFFFDFADGKQGWDGGFADLPYDYDPEIYKLTFQHRILPIPAGKSTKGLFLNGWNRSDDLFSFIKHKFDSADGLKPNTTYDVYFEFDLLTNLPSGGGGVGGPPESVYMKVGGADYEPKPIVAGEIPYYVMNIDKGNQGSGGEHAVVIGHAAKIDSKDDSYQVKKMNNANFPFKLRTDWNGTAWVIIGTDSGFESESPLYYTNILLKFTAIE